MASKTTVSALRGYSHPPSLAPPCLFVAVFPFRDRDPRKWPRPFPPPTTTQIRSFWGHEGPLHCSYAGIASSNGLSDPLQILPTVQLCCHAPTIADSPGSRGAVASLGGQPQLRCASCPASLRIEQSGPGRQSGRVHLPLSTSRPHPTYPGKSSGCVHRPWSTSHPQVARPGEAAAAMKTPDSEIAWGIRLDGGNGGSDFGLVVDGSTALDVHAPRCGAFDCPRSAEHGSDALCTAYPARTPGMGPIPVWRNSLPILPPWGMGRFSQHFPFRPPRGGGVHTATWAPVWGGTDSPCEVCRSHPLLAGSTPIPSFLSLCDS